MSEIKFDKLCGIKRNELLNPNDEAKTILETMELAKSGLANIKSAKQKVQTLQETHDQSLKTVDYGKELYEPYNSIAFEGKVHIDLAYYDQLFQKLDEEVNVEDALGHLYKTIREIYEFVNIEPQTYGRNITIDFLNESVENQQKKLSDIIYEYIGNHFYKLTPEKRKEKYMDESKVIAKELIAEGADPDEAIQFAIKTVVMEGLLRRISFPQHTWYRINYLMEDPNYGAVFDQADLIELVETFNKQIKGFSKIVSAVI